MDLRQLHKKNDQARSFYVIIPWMLGSHSLPSFIKNKQAALLNLSSRELLKAIYTLLAGMWEAWQRAKFVHMDCKNSQVIVLAPFALRLVDYGHSAIDVVVNSKHYKVEPRQISTRDFGEDIMYFMGSHNLMLLLAANPSNKDDVLLKEYIRMRQSYEQNKISFPILLAWLKSL